MNTVLLLEGATPDQLDRVFELLAELNVDHHTLVRDGQAAYFAPGDVQAADFRNLQADLVAEALHRAVKLDTINLARHSR